MSQQWQWYKIDHSLKSQNTSHALWVTCWVHSANTSKKTAHVITGPNCMERWHTNRNELEIALKQIFQISNSFVMHLQIKAWFFYSQNTLWPTTHCTEGRSAYYGHQLKEHIPPQSWPSRAKQLRTNSKWKKMENITFKEFVTGWYLIQHIETLSKYRKLSRPLRQMHGFDWGKCFYIFIYTFHWSIFTLGPVENTV